MSPENSTPEDAQPLARPVHDQPLARPVGAEQEEAEEEQLEETPQAEEQQEETPQPEAEEKGPVEKALDKAQENGWVYDSVARQARERGLASKADEL
ncbi:MAG: hypothetical protein M3N18_08245, partial [Actinomycetota bacterium]|nr:hypothetical protein [Actinomycetota bacterium]